MKEVLSVPGHVRSIREPREHISNGRYNISFEPGIHPPTGAELVAVRMAFQHGEPVHFWNREVAGRVQSYKPQLVTIDSLNMSYDNKVDTWLSLPAKPGDMNPSGSIFVVRADQLHPSSFTDAFQNADGEVEPIADTLLNVIKTYEREGSYQEPTPDSDLVSGLGFAGVLVGAGIVSIRAGEKFSRRKFLLGGGTIAGSSIIAGTGILTHGSEQDKRFAQSELMEKRASLATTAEERAGIVAEYDATSQQFPNPWFAARNALFVLKTKGAYDRMQFDSTVPSAIIAGRDHLTGMTRMLQDEAYAGKTLRHFGRVLFGAIDEYFEKPMPGDAKHVITPDEAKQLLVKTISLTAIDYVQDPDPQAFKENPGLAIDESVSRIEDIYQDERTMKALAPLL